MKIPTPIKKAQCLNFEDKLKAEEEYDIKRDKEGNGYSYLEEEFEEQEKYDEEHYKEEEYDMNPEDEESKTNINEDEVWCWNHNDKHKEWEEYESDYEDEDEKSENEKAAKYSIFDKEFSGKERDDDEGLDEAEITKKEIEK